MSGLQEPALLLPRSRSHHAGSDVAMQGPVIEQPRHSTAPSRSSWSSRDCYVVEDHHSLRQPRQLAVRAQPLRGLRIVQEPMVSQLGYDFGIGLCVHVEVADLHTSRHQATSPKASLFPRCTWHELL